MALDPEIVVAGSFISVGRVGALNDLNIRVELYGSTNKISDSYAQIRSVGMLAGRGSEAEELIAQIEQALTQHAADPGHQEISAVLWQPGQIVPGETTMISQLMRLMGFSSHSQSRGLGQADFLPLENILADPPELLLIAGDARAQRHSALVRLEDTQIEFFDPSLLYCGGPTIIRAVERLAQIREAMN